MLLTIENEQVYPIVDLLYSMDHGPHLGSSRLWQFASPRSSPAGNGWKLESDDIRGCIATPETV